MRTRKPEVSSRRCPHCSFVAIRFGADGAERALLELAVHLIWECEELRRKVSANDSATSARDDQSGAGVRL